MNYNGHFTHEFDRCQSPMPSVSGDSPLASSDATGQSPDTDEGHTDHQLEAAYRGCAFAGAMFLLMLLLCLLLSSCSTTKYIEVPITQHDTLVVVDHQRDSVYLHDSISVKQAGDTVWVQEWHTKYKLKEVHDTTIVATHDTIAKPYPIIEYEPKPLSWWQRTLQYLGYIALAAIVLGIILLILKIKKL